MIDPGTSLGGARPKANVVDTDGKLYVAKFPSKKDLENTELIEHFSHQLAAKAGMCVGDKWELYIPDEMGYGKFSQPGIPGGSTLIFEIELLGIA